MTLTHTTAGFYQGYTLEELEEAILWELGQVIGTEVSYERFPQAKIRKKLTNRQNKFVAATHCLKKFALIRAKEGYRQYKLPINCIDGGVIAAKFYETSDSYQDLEIVDLDFMNSEMEGYLTDDNSTPEYAFMGDSYGNIPMLEVHPAPDADGITLSPDTGVTIGGDLPGATSNVAGQATGGSSTTLEDSTKDFTTLGLVGGMYVRNVSDGSYAYILTVATTTLTFASALTGGTTNTFNAGDSYNILAGEYGVLVDWEDDDQYIFSSEVGLLANIVTPADNFRVDFVPYPLEFPASLNPGMYPEIPKLYHLDALVMGVVADFLKTFHEKTREFKRADVYELIAQTAIAEASAKKSSRPFRNKPVNVRPRFK